MLTMRERSDFVPPTAPPSLRDRLDAQRQRLEVDVAPFQRDGLADAQSRRDQELGERSVRLRGGCEISRGLETSKNAEALFRLANGFTPRVRHAGQATPRLRSTNGASNVRDVPGGNLSSKWSRDCP